MSCCLEQLCVAVTDTSLSTPLSDILMYRVQQFFTDILFVTATVKHLEGPRGVKQRPICSTGVVEECQYCCRHGTARLPGHWYSHMHGYVVIYLEFGLFKT